MRQVPPVLIAACVLALSGPLSAQEVSEGSGAVLRGLDKVDGAVHDIELPIGGSALFGRLTITLKDCRYPTGNPAGDAFASLTITEKNKPAPDFEGWMIASAPALNALDHPRYDVWVMRCKTE